MRLIDADELKRKYAGWYNIYGKEKSIHAITTKEIDWMPTIDAASIVHGFWKDSAGKPVALDELNPNCPETVAIVVSVLNGLPHQMNTLLLQNTALHVVHEWMELIIKMRLIDADAFDRDLCDAKFSAALNHAYDENRAFEEEEMYYSTQSFRDVMKYRPTIDAKPVVHAQWEKMTGMMIPELHGYHECSYCGWHEDYHKREFLSPYCPNCGAEMSKEYKP